MTHSFLRHFGFPTLLLTDELAKDRRRSSVRWKFAQCEEENRDNNLLSAISWPGSSQHLSLEIYAVSLHRIKPCGGKIYEDWTACDNPSASHQMQTHWRLITQCMHVPRCHPKRDKKQRCFILSQKQDKVTRRHRAAVNNLLLQADGFQMIMSKRGYALGLQEALGIIPSGKSHIPTLYIRLLMIP